MIRLTLSRSSSSDSHLSISSRIALSNASDTCISFILFSFLLIYLPCLRHSPYNGYKNKIRKNLVLSRMTACSHLREKACRSEWFCTLFWCPLQKFFIHIMGSAKALKKWNKPLEPSHLTTLFRWLFSFLQYLKIKSWQAGQLYVKIWTQQNKNFVAFAIGFSAD